MRALARVAKVSHPAIMKIERGATDVFSERSQWTWIKLAQHFKDTFGLDWLESYIEIPPALNKRPAEEESEASEKNFEPQIAYPPIGERVRDARKDYRDPSGRKLSTTELGARIGLSNVAISRGETGERNFSKQTIYAIAQELGTDFGEPEIHNHLQAWLSRMGRVWGNGEEESINDVATSPEEDVPETERKPIKHRKPKRGGKKT